MDEQDGFKNLGEMLIAFFNIEEDEFCYSNYKHDEYYDLHLIIKDSEANNSPDLVHKLIENFYEANNYYSFVRLNNKYLFRKKRIVEVTVDFKNDNSFSENIGTYNLKVRKNLSEECYKHGEKREKLRQKTINKLQKYQQKLEKQKKHTPSHTY